VLADVLGVLAFVMIGRASHQAGESLAGVTSTAWPFLVGLAAGEAATRAWRRPAAVVPTGVGVWLATVALGQLLRVVSGQGTDSTERGRIRWARVKGATENALRELPMRNFAFRPGFIQPLHGITSKTPVYALAYRLSGPLLPVLRRLAPNAVTTTEVIGRAMIAVAEHGYPKPVLETRDLNAAAE